MKLSYAGYTILVWVPTVVSTVVLGVRIFIRSRLRNQGIEDLLMAASCVLLILAASFTQIELLDVYSNNSYNIKLYTASASIGPFLLTLCLLLGKASVAFMMLRISGSTSRWRKWLVYSTLAILVGVTIPVLVVDIIPECDVAAKYRYTNVCIPDSNAVVGFSELYNFYSAGFDILFSILPATIIWKLKLSPQRRLCLVASLGLGWVAAAFALLRALSGFVWPAKSEALSLVSALASVLEPSLLIICGCLASLRPLLEFLLDGRPLRPRQNIVQPSASKFLNPGQADTASQLPALKVERTISVSISSEPV